MPSRALIKSAFTYKYDTYLGYGYDAHRHKVSYDLSYPVQAFHPSYQTGGGNLTVKVHGSLIGADTSSSKNYAASALDTYWLWTEPFAASPTWFINFGTYYQPYLKWIRFIPVGGGVQGTRCAGRR